MQDLSGFDSKDTRLQRGSRSTLSESQRGGSLHAPSASYSPEPGPLKRGLLTLPSQKSSKGPALGRRREGFQEVDIQEEQVMVH